MVCNGLIAAILWASSAATDAVAPQVIETTPACGAVRVDPALPALRVRFDQDMSHESFSWTGGGPAFPATNGKPHWTGPRDNELPVQLEPGHLYAVGINGGRFNGFRSAEGLPAEPTMIVFATARTLGADDHRNVAASQDAFDRLRELIGNTYSHRDLRGIDWDSQFDAYRSGLVESDSPAAFAVGAWQVLAPTQDMHIALQVGKTRIGLPQPAVELNFNGRAIGRLVPEARQRSGAVAAGTTADGIGYILIQTWDRRHEAAIAEASNALDEMLDVPALVIDVRPNGGGDEALAARFAGRFVESPVVYAKHQWCDPDAPDGFAPVVSRTLEPSGAKRRYEGRVCVLMGPANASSCEAFLLMMRQVSRCTLVGSRSRGSSGNPQGHDLGNGVIVHLPSWRALDAQARPFEGVGLAADIEVIGMPNATGDPVLERALALLRGPENKADGGD